MRRSAGLLPYRRRGGRLEVLLVHPGGPLWAKRDAGAWSVPKGELEEGEADELAAARRELEEETSWTAPADRGAYVPLGEVRQKGGKEVVAWAFEAPELDPATLRSNDFEMEWPPRSGRRARFPEVDRAEWLGIEEARAKLLPAQEQFLDRLVETL